MTSSKDEPTGAETSEQQQDDEDVERFADESPAEEPHFEVTKKIDPDESSEQHDDKT